MAETVIFSGGYGSGKSEVALNYALHEFEKNRDLVLADLDLINPYFVIRSKAKELEKIGLKLLAPSGVLAMSDVPNIPGSMLGVFKTPSKVVIDLAGDEAGATVLGYLSRHVLSRVDYEFILVVNPYRPFAERIEELLELKIGLERAGRLQFTSIVSNPNLLYETTPLLINAGHERVKLYAEQLDIPITKLAIDSKFYEELYPQYGDLLLPLNLYLSQDYLH